jgi:hypothetical protein
MIIPWNHNLGKLQVKNTLLFLLYYKDKYILLGTIFPSRERDDFF